MKGVGAVVNLLERRPGSQRGSRIPRLVDQNRSYLRHSRRLKQIAASLPVASSQRQEIATTRQEWLATVAPMPVSVAAHLLRVSIPTIKHWIEQGLLIRVGDQTPIKLDAGRVFDIADVAERLREQGRINGMLDAIWYRLADQELLESKDLHESLEQMRRGQGTMIRSDASTAQD